MTELATVSPVIPSPARDLSSVGAAGKIPRQARDDSSARSDTAALDPSDGADVSRPTFAQNKCASYRSPVRERDGKASRRRLVDAALDLMRQGDYHCQLKAVTSRAGFATSAIRLHFDSLPMFRRYLARFHWEAIAEIAGLDQLPKSEQRRLVWLIVAGCPEPALP